MLFKLESYYYMPAIGYERDNHVTYIIQDKIVSIDVRKGEYSTIKTITETYIIKTERAIEIVSILDKKMYGCN